MQAEEFVKRVRVRADLDDNEEALKATKAVMDTLRARISHQGGDNVAEQLPKELKQLWESGVLDHILRMFSGSERMDLGAFLARVASQLNLEDIRQAETVTRAVFSTMQEQITPGATAAVEHQLPPDILAFWRECRPEQPAAEPPPQEPPQVTPDLSAPTPEEEVGARAWGPETDLPSGADVEMTEAQTEAQVREMAAAPAEQRAEMEAPPEARSPDEGPGSDVFYRGDVDLTNEIVRSLEESHEIDATHIDVLVQAGNVTLRGKVPTQTQKDAAHHLVASSLGVGAIRNELAVGD